MGANQSQENTSQTFSTIGLPPSTLYSQPQRSHSLRVPSDRPSTSRHYQPTQTVEDSDGWMRIDRTPPSNSAPQQPPSVYQQRPLPPRPLPPITNRERPPRRQDPLLRDNDSSFMDIEQLLSTLHTLQLTHQNRNEAHGDSDSGSDPGERRRRHGTTGSSRPHPARLRQHRSAAPLIFIRQAQKVKCPVCFKEFSTSELDIHLPLCSAKPRVKYNEDKLVLDAGECSICLDDMISGDRIARLPCLCVYHLKCLKDWYKQSQTCPEHPDMK